MTTKNKAVIWSQPRCVWCDRAVALLTERGYEIEELKLNTQPDKLAFFKKFPSARTVPQIVLNGVHVGGFDDLKEFLRA